MRKKTKLVVGVGINDADYAVNPTVNGRVVVCKFYQTWQNMFVRCYSSKRLTLNPTYIGCSVSTEWHSFMVFRAWMMTQDWKGKHLDKDLLYAGNKVYSQNTCVFVSQQLNTLLLNVAAQRGSLPIGVVLHKNRFESRVNKQGKNYNLGGFKNKMIAHALWQKAKAEIIELAANEQTDERLKNSLMQRVYKLRDDLLNGRETIKL